MKTATEMSTQTFDSRDMYEKNNIRSAQLLDRLGLGDFKYYTQYISGTTEWHNLDTGDTLTVCVNTEQQNACIRVFGKIEYDIIVHHIDGIPFSDWMNRKVSFYEDR